MKLLSKEGMINVVKSEYNGHNVVDLARKYGYSMRHINRIIKDNNLKIKGEQQWVKKISQ